ncbi:MAG: hypothetical protein IMZ65_00670 [Planctomycetes bacterium]|nr:hypothetical protein [Planctomycetota bacterium]
MARAEDCLVKKDWQTADESASLAERKYEAPPAWVANFRERFIKTREIDARLNEADLADKGGDIERAITMLSDLSAQNPEQVLPGGQKLSDRIAELRDKLEMRQYRQFADEGKRILSKGILDKANLDAAMDQFNKARKVRETPEILELIKGVENERKAVLLYAQAEKAVADGKWNEAWPLYGEVLKLKPSETVRKKMNDAHAEDLASQAATLRQNGLMKESLALYMQVLQLNPRHPDALAFIKIQGQKEQLENFIKAGDEAMAKQQWGAAIVSYTAALPLMDAKDTAGRTRIDAQIKEAKYQMAMAKAREAMAQDQFDLATAAAAEAQGVNDTQDVKDFLAEVDKSQKYKVDFDLGAELLNQQSYVKALGALQRAQKTKDTDNVREMILEAQYRRYLANGKSLQNDGRLKEALAQYNIAKGYKDTAEIQARRKLAEDMINSGKKE